ncbi:MAG: ABC transporter permease [Bdellovibrionaceae bacterium]|nr:ABC transporter permease [Pseudobdellovibrionaceae bacterium]|tara:strand:- start:101822 stop:102613 length:792 start_codon:yes stop_codon:yes gene_type:complete
MNKNLKWTPFMMLYWREVRRFSRVAVQTLLAPAVNTTLYLLIFGVSIGRAIKMEEGITYLGFLIPGLIMMGCLNNAFSNASSSVAGSKSAGELEDYKSSPLSSQQIIWALSAGGVSRGLLVSVVTMVVGELFYLNQHGEFLPINNVFLLFYFLLVGGFAFGMMGLSAAIWARSFDHLSAVGNFVLLPLIYLGGVFYSIDNLPGFWQKVSLANPLLYLINGVRYAILGVSDVSLGVSVLVTLIMLLVFLSISVWSLARGSFHRW